MVDLSTGLKGMALNLVTDTVDVVVLGDVRAIIGSDSMECTATIADVHRFSFIISAVQQKLTMMNTNMIDNIQPEQLSSQMQVTVSTS